MIPMDDRRLRQTIWVLAALTALYAVVNVAVFYVTGTFGTAWFVTSLIVYGAVFAAAVALTFVEKHAPLPRAPAVAREPPSGRAVQAEAQVAAAPQQVLQAFVDVESIRRWWGAASGRVDAQEGGAWHVAWGRGANGHDGQSLHGYVRTFEPWKRLVVGGLTRLDHGASVLGPTLLEIQVERVGQGSRVHVRETGFLDGPAWDGAYEAALTGWPDALQRLKQALEHAPVRRSDAPEATPERI